MDCVCPASKQENDRTSLQPTTNQHLLLKTCTLFILSENIEKAQWKYKILRPDLHHTIVIVNQIKCWLYSEFIRVFSFDICSLELFRLYFIHRIDSFVGISIYSAPWMRVHSMTFALLFITLLPHWIHHIVCGNHSSNNVWLLCWKPKFAWIAGKLRWGWSN